MEGLGMRRIQIGTRGSRLALAQAELVKCRIEEIFPGIQAELVPIVTKGDKMLDRPLDQLGGKGAFTKELEEQLLDGRIDLAVHSAKDLPMELPKGLCIGAVTERANPVDVLVTRNGRKLSEWQEGMTVGTGSLRRMLQLQEINEKVRVKPIRGNIETRLKKLRDGQYDGVILAAAGMMRLKLQLDQQYQWEYLNTEEFLPAAGQGILAVECRTGALEEICRAIHSEKAGLMLEAEREFLKQTGGSCNAPAACICEKEGQALKLRAAYWLSTPEGYKEDDRADGPAAGRGDRGAASFDGQKAWKIRGRSCVAAKRGGSGPSRGDGFSCGGRTGKLGTAVHWSAGSDPPGRRAGLRPSDSGRGSE